uniref:Uncharacterized protein n=1 Tax=Anguilla anguilla TaxID=7936 RepID=A0A0E9QFX4_ANGAN
MYIIGLGDVNESNCMYRAAGTYKCTALAYLHSGNGSFLQMFSCE